MTSFGLAWRGLTRQPARALLGIAGIAVVGALLFDMLMLSRGLALSFQRLLDAAGFDVRVTATEAFPGMGPRILRAAETLASIRALSEVEAAAAVRFGRAEALSPDGETFQISLLGNEGHARNVWRVIEGQDLAPRAGGPPPLLINRDLAARLGAAPGTQVRLRGACSAGATALPTRLYEVIGIVEFNFDSVGAYSAVTSLEEFFETCDLADRDAVDMLLVASTPAAGTDRALAVIRSAHPDLHAFTNRHLVARLQESNFSYFRQVSFALSTVTLFFSFLLVATLLTVSFNQRLAEVAALRALGFRRRRIVADLLWQSALLVGTGGVLALPLGGLLALRLDSILRGMPGLPVNLHFFVFEVRALMLHAGLLIATGLLASLYPIYLAARLPIAETLRRETVS